MFHRLQMLKLKAALAALLLAVWTSACGGGGTPAAKVADRSELLKQPVELTFYRPNNGTTNEQFMDLMGSAIQTKFPNVTVKFIPWVTGSKFEDVLSSGQDLDIVLLSIGYVPQFSKFGLGYDLNDLIKQNNFDLSHLENTSVDFIKKFGSGAIYALPIFTTAEVLAYNKDIFDKFGVPYPKDGMTWDELYDLSKKLTRADGGIQYYGFMASMSHMLRVNQLSLPFVDPASGKPNIDTEEFRNLANNFSRFYSVNGVMPPKEKYNKEGDMFTKDRNLAMYAYFNSVAITAPSDMNLDMVTLPSFKEFPGVGSQMYPTYAGISSTSKHKEMAFEVLKYLTTDEMQTKFAKDGTGLPVVKNAKLIEAYGQDLPQLKGKNKQAGYPLKPAAITTKSLYDDLVEKQALNAFKDVIQGNADIITASRKASEQAVKDLEAAKSK